MSFFDDICENLGVENTPQKYRATIIDDCGYFENVRSILSYSTDSVVFLIKGGRVEVSGSDLYIKKYCLGDLAICGKIKSIVKQ